MGLCSKYSKYASSAAAQNPTKTQGPDLCPRPPAPPPSPTAVCCPPLVIRYDLEFLGLCPALVDVEIIDAKNTGQSQVVTIGAEGCTCNGKVGGWLPAWA